MQYAILNEDGKCINRILWDGITPWNPPAGCQAIPDPDNQYPFLPNVPKEETSDS